MAINNSINTNVGAMVALRNLNNVNDKLSSVQNRVSTGLKVSSAKDDASTFSVAQGVRANIKAFESVNQSLSQAKGVLNVANEAATNVSDLLSDVKGKLVELSDESLTSAQREILTEDLVQQTRQVESFIDRAEFNGKNILKSVDTAGTDSPLDDNAPTDVKVVQGVDGDTLTVRATNLTGAAGGSTAPTGFLNFARIAFDTAGADDSDATANLTTNSGEFVARTSVSAEQARAALGDSSGNASNTTSMLDAFNEFESEVNTALGKIGADNRNVEFQQDFNGALRDATEQGLGSLVDADLARESARLQALQTKQQLSTQTLSIANQSPQVLLGLFN